MPSKYPASPALAFAVISIFSIAGCHKQVAKSTPPQAAPPVAQRPTATLSASPGQITFGAKTTLTWSSANASAVSLSPVVGAVAPQGSLSVSPGTSTTYTLTATSAAGSAEASTRVTVTVLASPASVVPPDVDALFAQHMQDAFFNYDKAELRADARSALTEDSEFLRSYSQLAIVIEGHCDERGSEEYNLALGDRRADAAKNYLVSLGIPADRIRTASVGKERPFCNENNESCWRQNRRGHFERIQ
jgi:peptidoglycan-associated lipoprotein